MRWLIALLLAVSTLVEGATLHSLLVGQPDSHTIGVRLANKLDIGRAGRELFRLAEFGGYEYSETRLNAEKVSAEVVVSVLNHLEIKPDDIVIFYYTGHGHQGESHWPELFFDYGKKTLKTEDIAALLHSKGPQSALILTDCSNEMVSPKIKSAPLKLDCEPLKLAPMPKGSKPLAELKGVVLATAARPNTTSFVGANGSLYTCALASSLRQELVMEEPEWERLFERAEQLVGERQQPLVRFYHW